MLSHPNAGYSTWRPVGALAGLRNLTTTVNRARKCVTINGVTPRDWSSLGTKRDNWGLVTRIIHNKIVYGICILHCCTFDKHLYLTSCLNAHKHNTCTCTFAPNRLYYAKNGTFHY